MIKEGSYYLRNPDVVIVSTADRYLYVDANGLVTERTVTTPDNWSQLMRRLMVPIRGDHLHDLLEDTLEIGIDEVSPLVEEGLLIEAATPGELEGRRDNLLTNNQAYYLSQGEQKCEHLVVGITGSIVAGLMAPVILSLCYSGFQTKIDLILTEAALRFVQRDLFEYYGIDTWGSAFERQMEFTFHT